MNGPDERNAAAGGVFVAPKPLTALNVLLIAAGSALYACAVSWFMKPLALYAGGVVGLAQLISALLFGGGNAGIVNLALNVPLFLLAYRTMPRKMLLGTVISVAVQTLVFTFLPVPAGPILDDKLACIIIAGLLGGAGCGLILTNGGSAGGLDLLGVWLTQHTTLFSVGALNITFNAVLYGVCAILFEIGTAIYSVAFVAAFSLAVDRFHYQNIEVELMIFTHSGAVAGMIMEKYVRGVTEWDGRGAYTKQGTHVLVTVVAKSEEAAVRRDIRAADPQAFIIEHPAVTVTGGYQKRLV